MKWALLLTLASCLYATDSSARILYTKSFPGSVPGTTTE